jgi:DNA polymerase III sliding clamp (beta) subunit (PCNA family)
MKSHVLHKIDELFKDRINNAYVLREMTEQDIANEVYERVHTPARIKIIEEMAADVAEKFSILSSSSEFYFDAQPTQGIERRITGKWNKSKPMLPVFSNNYHAPDVKTFTEDAKKAMIDADTRRRSVIAEREAFKVDFAKAYEQVRSVNELIKIWPAVIELLPAGTMDRINKKTGPRVFNPEAIDAAGLSVQLLKAKVAK